MWRYIIISSTLSLILIVYFFSRSGKPEVNQCDMTHMYRFMHYLRIPVNIDLWKSGFPPSKYPFSMDFSSYSTVLYGEGAYAANFMSTGKVTGYPIIFVPGNAGSSRQVRSLGSLLLNKTESTGVPFTFDTFAVDFNEELSGISGMYIERQTKYLELVVDHVWNMYDEPPPGIVFIGHSVGGILIRSLLRSNSFNTSRISFIITLATPHRSPPVIFDSYLEFAYKRMQQVWKEKFEQGEKINLISISGGLKDLLVPEWLTQDDYFFHYSTTGIDRIELEADHLCIVWCNQLVRHISRLIFDYASSPTNFLNEFDHKISRHHNFKEKFCDNWSEVPINRTILSISTFYSFIKNDLNDSQIYELVGTSNASIFVLFSGSSSCLFMSNRDFFGVHKLGRNSYALIPSDYSPYLRLHPKSSLKGVSVYNNETITIGFFDYLFGFYRDTWSLNFEKDAFILKLSVNLDSPVIVARVVLERVECYKSSKGLSLIEFRSKFMRRTSTHQGSIDEVIVHLLSESDSDAQILFVLSSHCRYAARISVSYRDSLYLAFQKYVPSLPVLLSLYMFIIFCTYSLRSTNRRKSLRCSIFTEYGRITSLNLRRNCSSQQISSIFIMIIAYGLCTLATYLLSRLWIFSLLRYEYLWSKFRLFLIIVGLFVNYFYNGFFAYAALFIANILKLLSLNCIYKNAHQETFSIIFLFNILSFSLLLPCGICSIWNLRKYNLITVEEDPARLPAYSLGILLIMQIFTERKKINFLKTIFPAMFLPIMASIQSFVCFSQLCMLLTFVIGLSPFYLYSLCEEGGN